MLKKAFFLMLSVEVLSLLAFVYQSFSLPLLIVAGVLTLWLSLKNLQYGIYILFGELFIGSRGHLLEHGVLSLRLVIFVAVFAAWLASSIRSRRLWFDLSPPKADLERAGERLSPPPSLPWRGEGLREGWSYWLLLLVIVAGAMHGYFAGNGIKNVFLDVNGYLYLAILPAVLAGIKTREAVNNLFQILAAAIILIAAKTLLLFVWFAYALPGVATAYHWIIEREIGEITGVVGSASRIFMQSQFWALVGVFIFGLHGNLKVSVTSGDDVAEVFRPPLRWLIIFAAVFSVVLSLSRSFWLGAIAGAIFFAGVWLFKLRWGLGRLAKLGGIIILIAALEIGGLYLLSRGGDLSESVASRGINPAKEAAGSARLMLLPELLGEIKESPLIGKGFGEEVIYKSYLPDRITKNNPEGEIMSYAFEWGYLDIMLKVGIFGLLVYLLFIANIFKQGISKFQILGILSGLVALLVLNITTPYLNHPLGIGYLIFALVSFKVETPYQVRGKL